MNKRKASTLAESVAAECIAYRVRLLNRVITNINGRALQEWCGWWAGVVVPQRHLTEFIWLWKQNCAVLQYAHQE